MNNIRQWVQIVESAQNFGVTIQDYSSDPRVPRRKLGVEFYDVPEFDQFDDMELVVHKTNDGKTKFTGFILDFYVSYNGKYRDLVEDNLMMESIYFRIDNNGNISIDDLETPSQPDIVSEEIAHEIAPHTGDAPDQNSELYAQYVDRLARHIQDNMVINREKVLKDINTVISYVKTHIGTNFDEIARHAED